MHLYTVTIYEVEETPVESNWTSFPAAKSFADTMYQRRHTRCVTIWNGFNPETGPAGPVIKEHADLLYFQEKPALIPADQN